jgi:hypothetical protein
MTPAGLYGSIRFYGLNTFGVKHSLTRMLKPQEAKALGEAISNLVKERGLGAISKKDYELLVFHHLTAGSALQQDGNYHLANKLKVTETKVKGLRLEASIRHCPANHKAVLGQIVHRIICELSKPEFKGDEVVMTLENPIDRREFEHAVKRTQHNVEYGMNREILRIAPIALFEVILANVDDAETHFKKIVQACIETQKRQEDILDDSLTLRQKINKLGEAVTSNEAAVAMLSAAANLLQRL